MSEIRKMIEGDPKSKVNKPSKINLGQIEEKKLVEIKEYLEIISNFYNVKNVIARGFLNGVFAGIGAIVGVAIFIIITTQIQGFPLIKEFMHATGLDIVVEYALQQTNTESGL